MAFRNITAEQKPVYVINGFLDSGKSSFFAFTLGQPYFQTEGKTLLILCEEGELEYDDALLKQSRTVVERIEKESDFSKAAVATLVGKHNPERVLIEWNGMWNFRNFELPKSCRLEQQISCIDASTFGVYYSNLAMRSLLFEELKNSELVLFNRCDGIDFDTLVRYKRNVKAIAQQADLIFENAQGEVDLTTEEDLPYDLNQDVIELEGINYGIWYLDAMEHPDRYVGKKIRYVGLAAKPDDMPACYFAPGRMAMTCCAQDMQFLGYACRYEGLKDIDEGTWVEVTAKVSVEEFAPYGGAGIVLHAEEVKKTKEPAEPVINFAG